MKVLSEKDIKLASRDKKLDRSVLKKIEPKPEPKNEQLEVFKKLTEAITSILLKPALAPQVTVQPATVKIDMPKPAKKWNFKGTRSNNGEWNLTTERIE